MIIIRPQTVTDAALYSSNVVETAPAAYNAGTTYAAGATAYRGTVGQLLTVYTSLQNGNTGNTPESSPAWWSVSGYTYAAYSGATTYASGDLVQNNTTHLVYESLAAGNVGNALTNTAKWLEVSSTNRWKMFDNSNTAQTTNPNSIAVTLNATGRVDSVALCNISASSLRVTMTDETDGTVFDQTYSLISPSGIQDWWSYFYEPIVRVTDITVRDMPLYGDPTIAITLTETGGTAECGTCVIGLSKNIGTTINGMRLGITDYSRKDVDAFGNYSITERAFSKRRTFNVMVANSSVDVLDNLLASYRATPIVYVGSDNYASSIAYGFYKDFNVEINYGERSLCTLEIEGLT